MCCWAAWYSANRLLVDLHFDIRISYSDRLWRWFVCVWVSECVYVCVAADFFVCFQYCGHHLRHHHHHPHQHHRVVCSRIHPQPPPKRVLHIVTSSESSFNFQHLFVSLRSSSGCLCLLPRLSFHSFFLQYRVLESSFYARWVDSS